MDKGDSAVLKESEPEENAVNVDVAICGGGVAGLWLLARLRKAGFNAVLLESKALGAGQTRCAQGIIHGGTKYALTGKLTAAARTVTRMPALWLDCLQGNGELDLRQIKLLSANQYLWSTTSLGSKLSGFFASRAMHSRTTELKSNQRPKIFQSEKFKGQVYQLSEPVLDAMSIVKALAEPNMEAILKVEDVRPGNPEMPSSLQCVIAGETVVLKAKKLVLAAGKGNAALLSALGRKVPEMQLRPLKMVMLRGNLPQMLYAHCLGASINPRMTITSHTDINGEIVWYVGGQLAETGPALDDKQLLEATREELTRLFPWVDFSAAEWACLSIDRAEPKQADGKRPDSVFAEHNKDVVTVWPTKLALAPILASQVLELLQDLEVNPSGLSPLPQWPHPAYAVLPWQEESRWHS